MAAVRKKSFDCLSLFSHCCAQVNFLEQKKLSKEKRRRTLKRTILSCFIRIFVAGWQNCNNNSKQRQLRLFSLRWLLLKRDLPAGEQRAAAALCIIYSAPHSPQRLARCVISLGWALVIGMEKNNNHCTPRLIMCRRRFRIHLLVSSRMSRRMQKGCTLLSSALL